MTTTREDLVRDLLASHPEFKQLFEEHRNSERRLTELQQAARLSESSEAELKQLKRHKLYLKDRMEEILRDRLSGVPA